MTHWSADGGQLHDTSDRLKTLATLRLSAASGVVVHQGLLHVIADDRHSLHRYTPAGVLVDCLPLYGVTRQEQDQAIAKARKADLEALLVLPDQRLLALGSGSTPRRQTAFCWRESEVVAVSLAPLYKRLADEFAELNIEGATVFGDALMLAQRGNGAGAENALIELDLTGALLSLAHGELSAGCLRRVHRLSLGALQGIPLGITDLAVGADGRLYFTAAAEASESTYADGHCLGSAMGVLDPLWSVADGWWLSPHLKIEGLACAASPGQPNRWLLVADADDPSQMAPLLSLD